MEKMKTWWMMAAVIGILSMSVLPAVSQDGLSVFPQDAFPDPQRPVSRFTHDDHMAFDAIEDCHVCHHVYENGKLVEGESSDGTPCGDCHGLKAEDGGVDRLRAYHGRCKGCHEDQRVGPMACGECHVRD